MSKDVFDNLEILEVEEETSPTGNLEVASELAKKEKNLTSTELLIDKTYPYLEIILDEESRMNAVTKNALDTLFTKSISKVDSGEDIKNLAEVGISTKLCLGVSIGDAKKVIGNVDITQIRYVYNLLRNLKLSFEPEEGITLHGSNVLALI